MSELPTIEVHTMVFGFQRRYWWQLSSLLDQQADGQLPVPRIRAVFSVTERDPWFAWNERILDVFGDRMDIRMDVWPASDDSYGRRGHIRTRNLRDCRSEYLLFNDGDMVYSRTFFARLLAELRRPDRQHEHRVFATWRMSMAFEDGYRLTDQADYEAPIERPAEQVAACKCWPAAHARISGAGFFQAVNMRGLRAYMASQGQTEEFYVEPGWNKDHDTFRTNHITRSDRHFRLRCGGIVPLPDLPPQYHLNHYRKNDQQWQPYRLH